MARKEFVAGKAAGRQEGYTSTHFTPETAVIDLLKLIPFESGKEFWYDKNFTAENSYSFCSYCGGSMTKTH